MVCERYQNYGGASLVWHFFAGLGSVIAHFAKGRPTILESECIARLAAFFRSSLVPAFALCFLYGFGFAFLPTTRLPSVQIFRDFAMPHFGGIFVLYVVPAATASLVVIRGVVTLTSDLASMRAAQELDSLEVSSLHPVRFVFLPRALALIVGTPSLFVLGVFASFLGAWTACQFTFAPSLHEFWTEFIRSVSSSKAAVAFLKMTATAAVMAFVAGYFGFSGQATRLDTVGRTTAAAVVTATLASTTISIVLSLLA